MIARKARAASETLKNTMKIKSLLFAITCVLMQHAVRGDTLVPGGPVMGLWSLAGSPYLVQSNISIPSGAQLTIEPGVTVKFQANTSLQITGSMVAQGTFTNRIAFTSAAQVPAPYDWQGISVQSGGPRTVLDYVEIAYARTGLMISGDDSQVTLSHSDLHHCSSDGVDVFTRGGEYVDPLDVVIVQNSIHHSRCGIRIEAFSSETGSIANPTVEQNDIYANTYGIYASASSCVFCFARSSSAQGVISHNLLRENMVGLVGGASGRGNVSPYSSNNSFLKNTNNGIELGGGGTFVNNLVIANGENGIKLGGSSYATVVNNTIAANGSAGFNHDSGFNGYFRNNIVVSNGAGIRCTSLYTPATSGPPAFRTNIIAFNNVTANVSGNWSNYPAAYGSLTTTNFNGTTADTEGNISVNPQFIGAGDYHLQATSACVNAGTTNSTPSTDFDGQPRFTPSDIGAYELQPRFQFGAPARQPNGSLQWLVAVQGAYVFTIQRSSNLTTWTNVAVVTNLSGAVTFSTYSTNGPRAFFRAVP